MTTQNSTVLVSRLLLLKENSPFILVADSLAQSSHYLIAEFAHRNSNNHIAYLSYETLNPPPYASTYVECCGLSPESVVDSLKKSLPAPLALSKTLVIIDSLNYIPPEKLTHFISSCILPSTTIVGTFHTDIPQPNATIINYPSPISLLSYIASSIFDVEALYHNIDEETLDNKLSKLQFPINCGLNEPKFKVILTNRRKSGRSLIYKFLFDYRIHEFDTFKETEESADPEDESLLKDLTTFNLTTNSKQKLAREQVELPFMQAQEQLGSMGGAIVYEFEKDDDYDEEDPYEDPF